MQSVGERLREARVASGRSLDDVSAKTRINLKNLEAIENDDLTKISSPFFYKSFARQYAEELNLTSTSIADEIKATAATMPRPPVPGEAEDPTWPNVAAIRPTRKGRGWKALYSVFSLVVVLATCSTLYGFWQNSRSELQDSIDTWMNSVRSRIASAPKTNPARRVTIKPTSEQRSAAAIPPSRTLAAPPTTEPVDQPSRVELSATEPSWLSIVADGKESFAGILSAAQTRIFEGHTLRLRTGNAGGLSVVFNGKFLGPIGERGQVRTMLFSDDRYEVIQGTPVAHLMLTEFSPNGE
jgi:cytoskeleton protein RodZ